MYRTKFKSNFLLVMSDLSNENENANTYWQTNIFRSLRPEAPDNPRIPSSWLQNQD